MDFKVHALIKTRFVDIDWLGHVNNAHYLTFFEQARIEYFKKFPEIDFRNYDPKKNFSVILADARCSFKSPAYLDETLVVGIRTLEIKRSSFKLEYRIEEESSNRLIATGETIMVYYDYANQRSVEIPPELRRRFEKIEGRSFETNT